MGYLNLLSIPFPMSVGSAIVLTFGVVAIFLSFPIKNAEAAAVTWDGGGDGSRWSDPANWSGDTLPTSTHTITIDGNGDIDSYVGLDINFQLESSGYFTITSVDTLFINDGFMITINNEGTVNNTGVLDNIGTINNEGTINNDGAIFNEDTIENSGTINNSGSIANVADGRTINNNSGGTINNDGTIFNQESDDGGPDAIINNDGIINNNS